MNWNEIKEKYPKAFENLFESGMYHFDGHPRDLYDFFDERGIYVDVRPFYYDQLFFITGILTFVTDVAIDWTEKADTRTEAEEKAFEKAFEILENKLPIK